MTRRKRGQGEEKETHTDRPFPDINVPSTAPITPRRQTDRQANRQRIKQTGRKEETEKRIN